MFAPACASAPPGAGAAEGAPLGSQHEPIAEFARAALRAAGRNDFGPLMADDLLLRDLLSPASATRVGLVQRAPVSHALPEVSRAFVATSSYRGACVQGLRRAGPDDGFAPISPTWMFDRLLLEAQTADGDRFGMWLEGAFIRAEQGYRILLLDRVEIPRMGHADLDLAPCDLRDRP